MFFVDKSRHYFQFKVMNTCVLIAGLSVSLAILQVSAQVPYYNNFGGGEWMSSTANPYAQPVQQQNIYHQQSPADWGLAYGNMMQRSSDSAMANYFNGLKTQREREYLELQIRQQLLVERQAALQEEMLKKKNELLQKQIEFYEDSEKQILAKQINQNETSRETKEAQNGTLILPEKYKEQELNIKTTINQLCDLIDEEIQNGRYKVALELKCPSSITQTFPDEIRKDVEIFINKTLEAYIENRFGNLKK